MEILTIIQLRLRVVLQKILEQTMHAMVVEENMVRHGLQILTLLYHQMCMETVLQ